ncbi:MAG: S8 family serine peptidase, partial [Eubacterium sp.]|nr:S8 family serine peptidase [Eubacterium sp.]
MSKKETIKLLSIIIFIFYTFSACSIKENIDIKKQYQYDWAMYNYGQTINESNGEVGVDINIIPILSKIENNKHTVVAVVDSGIDYSNDILVDKAYMNFEDPIDGKDNDNNGFIDDYYGWNFYNNNNSIFEDALYDYHGTYIATTISRIAPFSQILSVKFLKSTSGSPNDAISAVQYAIDRGARIINCSWNFSEENEKLYEIMKNNSQVLFVCAAGNLN